jgi:hypothetical protein
MVKSRKLGITHNKLCKMIRQGGEGRKQMQVSGNV